MYKNNMKNNFSILKHTIIILNIIILFQNCNTAQKDDNTLVQVNVPIETSSSSVKEDPQKEENGNFEYVSKISLPSAITYVDAMCLSMFHLFIRQDKKVYVLNPTETDVISHEFDIIDFEGKEIEGINTLTKISYCEDLDQLFVLTESAVYRYDNSGKFLGELPKPSSSFKPHDIAFDSYRDGNVYILSRSEIVGEIFLWEGLEKEPRSVIKGDDFGIEIYSIEYGFSLNKRSLNILASSSLTDAIYQFSENTDKIWSEKSKINKSNNVDLAGALLYKVKTNYLNLFVLGDFEVNKGGAIKISEKGTIHKEVDLYVGEIKNSLNEFFVNPVTGKKNLMGLKDFDFYRSYTLYILCNGKLYKYKEKE